MATDKEGHFGAPALDKLHKPKDGTEDGACLTGHFADYKNKKNPHSCNYRYQAVEQAKSSSTIKAHLHSYKVGDRRIRTSAFSPGAKVDDPSFLKYYLRFIRGPRQEGDWHVTGPNRVITRETITGPMGVIQPGHNFTNAAWPYWNNAHHLIPKGTFSDMIKRMDAVSDIIQKALLKAKYNINHKRNMLLLPQDKLVARMLGLARHIRLGEDKNKGNVYTDHPEYNDLVSSKLELIMFDYKNLAMSKVNPKKHGIPNVDLDKTRLENLSTTMLRKTLAHGRESPGECIDEMLGEEAGGP
jgi:hypothetical protein